MADASGPRESTEIMNLLSRSTLDRGVLFYPSVGKSRPAKLRARSLRQLARQMSSGCELAVVWRLENTSDFKLWEGVVERWSPFRAGYPRNDGRWRVRYAQRPRETLPFPPYNPVVVLCAARLRVPRDVCRKKKRHRKSRKQSGKRFLRDSEGPRDLAVKKMLSIATLNVTTLKLKGDDEFSLRKSAHLYEVIGFMNRKGVHILCMQETRYRFSSTEMAEVLHRKVRYRKTDYHLYLTSARAKDAYNGMGVISSTPLINVSKLTERIMVSEFEMEDGVGHIVNVYSPTRDSAETEITEFHGDVESCCAGIRENNLHRPLFVLGDYC